MRYIWIFTHKTISTTKIIKLWQYQMTRHRWRYRLCNPFAHRSQPMLPALGIQPDGISDQRNKTYTHKHQITQFLIDFIYWHLFFRLASSFGAKQSEWSVCVWSHVCAYNMERKKIGSEMEGEKKIGKNEKWREIGKRKPRTRIFTLMNFCRLLCIVFYQRCGANSGSHNHLNRFENVEKVKKKIASNHRLFIRVFVVDFIID